MRNCGCSGGCGPQDDGLTRREFLELVGAGAAMTLLPGSVWGDTFQLPADDLNRWKRSLFEPASPYLYLSNKHTDARMHLGGIGTGNLEIGADGQLTTWQLFNTLLDGQVPFYFAVKSGSVSKLLQTTAGPEWPRVKQIEMTGEYPIATLRFRDDDLPVHLELQSFTPWEPLNTKLSSMPLAVFRFRISNPTSQAQTVSLAAMMTNPVGYEARLAIDGISHPSFGGNRNEFFREGPAAGLLMRAETGEEPKLDRAVSIYTISNLQGLTTPPMDRPESLKVAILSTQIGNQNELARGEQSLPVNKIADPANSIIWLEEGWANLSEFFLGAVRDIVQAGGTLVFSGAKMPLLQDYAAGTEGKPLNEAALRPDTLFEDFENGYTNWKIEGEAFGKEPAHGTLPNQPQVTGFIGKGYANSYGSGDDATGKLISKPFVIVRNVIRFLISGGNTPTTQIRLVINDKVCRATSGRKIERLLPDSWDVREFAGQTAHIEIVDDSKNVGGHINIDQIVFSDRPDNYAVMKLLEELLPARFSNIELPKKPDESGRVRFENLVMKEGSEQKAAANGLPLFIGPVGRGKVVLAGGQILNPAHAEVRQMRQPAYSMLCGLVGANYVPAKGQSPKSPGFGTLALATTEHNPTVLVDFKDWAEAWEQFSKQGHFHALESAKASSLTALGETIHGALATTVSVPAGGTVEVPFFLAWHYPNSYYVRTKKWIGCHYATQWTDARAVIRDAAANPASLSTKTELFRDTFYDSTLPYWLLDCVTANAAILRHIGIVFRTANGDLFGWEGSNGCCEPTCTHVWGYEQSLAFLFPDLERNMRRIDYMHQQNPDGGINNRTSVPVQPHPTGEHPFADGHASCILQAYREAFNSPDDSFFKEYWPHVKQAVEYLITRDAKTSGGQPIGILQDDQWNTYDEPLHGVTTFISGYYLAALRAGEEWARRMGDATAADRFHGIFESGQKKLVELCWNGEYFQQNLPDYLNLRGEFGPGCMSDQLLGQWWAHQLGLGYILPKDMVVTSLRSIFQYNWKSDLTGWKHIPVAYAGAKDKGLIICTWPKGGRPANVMRYSDEVWTGVEYQVAAHMIYEGLMEEAFCIIKGARERYDGISRPPIGRNPWSEIECGGHYSRAMSSWSLLLALSGYQYDSLRHSLRFAPCYKPDDFKSFFTASDGWGSLSQKSEGEVQKIEIAVKSGKLAVKTLEVAALQNRVPHKVTAVLGGKTRPVTFEVNGAQCHVTFTGDHLIVKKGEKLEIALS